MDTILMPMGTKHNVSVINKSKAILYAHTPQDLVEAMTISLKFTIFSRHYAGNVDVLDSILTTAFQAAFHKAFSNFRDVVVCDVVDW